MIRVWAGVLAALVLAGGAAPAAAADPPGAVLYGNCTFGGKLPASGIVIFTDFNRQKTVSKSMGTYRLQLGEPVGKPITLFANYDGKTVPFRVEVKGGLTRYDIKLPLPPSFTPAGKTRDR
jgi:hypothetical protein